MHVFLLLVCINVHVPEVRQCLPVAVFENVSDDQCVRARDVLSVRFENPGLLRPDYRCHGFATALLLLE